MVIHEEMTFITSSPQKKLQNLGLESDEFKS